MDISAQNKKVVYKEKSEDIWNKKDIKGKWGILYDYGGLVV